MKTYNYEQQKYIIIIQKIPAINKQHPFAYIKFKDRPNFHDKYRDNGYIQW